jgi:hypothetical protein
MRSLETGMGLISAERRMQLLFGFYFIALFMVVMTLAGSVEGAIFLIVVCELIFALWRPTPKLGRDSYLPPIPAGWQTPVRLLMGYQIISGCWSLVWGGLVSTVVFGIIIFAMKPSSFEARNWTVVAVIAVWLITRWVWAPPLYRAIARQLKGVGKELAGGGPDLRIGPDGFDIDFKVRQIGGGPRVRPFVFHLPFTDLDEVRTMDSNDAQAYWQSMEQYDPTLTARAASEIFQFMTGKLARPSIYQQLGVSSHVLMRGPTLLYLFGVYDESGPAAVAAWQQWRTAHTQVTAS